MAYNILKGAVEFTGENGSLENTVDLVSNQTIAGGKTFSQKLTASAIVLGGLPLSHPSVTAINNGASHRVVLFDASNPSNTLSGNVNLSFRYGALTSSYFTGSGGGLRNLQATEIAGALAAEQINFGKGLKSDSGELQVSGGIGISVDTTGGVKMSLKALGGLGFDSAKAAVDPTNATDVTTGGQNLADADVLLVQDVTHGLRKTTLTNLYSNYLSPKIPTAAIQSYTNPAANRIVVGTATSTTVNAVAALTFDGSKLSAVGQISASLGVTGSSIVASDLNIAGNSYLSGGIRKRYVYSDGASDYSLNGSDRTVIFNKSGHATASLPALNIDLNGIEYVIKNISANEVHVTGSGGPSADQFIDGQQSKTLTQGDSMTLLGFSTPSGYEWAVLTYYNVQVPGAMFLVSKNGILIRRRLFILNYYFFRRDS